MKTEYSVAIVGVTGLVGQKMLELLRERDFPVRELVPVASQSSQGKEVLFRGVVYPVQKLTEKVFTDVDIALFSAGAEVSRQFAPVAVQNGAVVIDNSSAWRMHREVPLVVPEVNPHALENHNGIIANPNCSTIQMVVALYPLHRRYGIRRIVVSTYQAVSGSGKAAMQQLSEEIRFGKSGVGAYPHPIAYNCLPHIDVFYDDGYTKEEHKMIRETRKILGDETIQISATCVRVPVMTGHSESVNVELQEPFTLDEVYSLLKHSPGVVVEDDVARNIYPMPIHCQEKDAVFVGRIRKDPSVRHGLNMWIVSDNLRKGAATNAVQIAEKLIAGDTQTGERFS